MSKHFSPLRYPGGKAKLTKFLAEILQSKSQSKDIVFVEPYAGGAGAALTLLLTGKVSKIVVNDLDPAIHAFWKTAVHDTDYLIRKIKNTEITMDEWRKQHNIYKRKTVGYKKLGFATFFLNRTNQSGIIEGGPIGGVEQKGKWKIDARFNKEGLIDRLNLIRQYRDSILVTNLDGISLLGELQNKANWMNHFIFIDPPYIEKGQFLYLNHHQNKDHQKLANFLNKTTLDWIVTYDDTPLVYDLYKNQSIHKFDIPHTARTRRIGKEVVIAPYNLKSAPKLTT